MTKLLTSSFNYNTAKNFLDSEDTYYLYVGNFQEQNSVSEIDNIVYDTQEFPWTNMIMGKKCSSNDFSLMINTISWVEDYAFEMYDDTSVGNDPLAVVTHEGSYYHFWKCLHNNDDANSTVQPLFTDITGPNTSLYQTSDGYIWKYLYSVDDTTTSKFKSGTMYPIVANSSTTSIANNQLNIFKVENPGRGYNNYIVSTLKTDDINVNGDKTLFKLSSSNANTSNGFYNNCIMYITSGDATGTIREITSYVSNGSGNYFQVDNEILTSPNNGDSFEIYPKVAIKSDEMQTTNCIARALVNSLSSNSIYRIETLQDGIGYRFATANVIANSIVGVSNTAEVRPIMPPRGGHGYDVFNELNCHSVSISVTLANSESDTILTSNKFQQYGLIRNPLFDNVDLVLKLPNNFDDYENVHRISINFISGYGVINVDSDVVTINNNDLTSGTVSVNASSANVTGTSTYFTRDYVADDYVILAANSTNGRQILQINNIVNNTHLVLKSNSSWTNTIATISPYIQRLPSFTGKVAADDYLLLTTANFESCQLIQVNNVVNSSCLVLKSNSELSANSIYVYNANVEGTSYIISSNSSAIKVTNCQPTMLQDSILYGETSKTINVIDSISRNNITKQYDTFVQLYKYTATIINGSFITGETVTQGNTSGVLHSVVGSGSVDMYFNNFNGGIFTEGAIIGVRSGATANVTSLMWPELIHDSGEIVYVENLEPITRTNTESQTFKILINF